QICGEGGCIVGQRQDACPGCSPVLFDLSESAFAAVCGIPSGVCAATVSVVQACRTVDLAWDDRPAPPKEAAVGANGQDRAQSSDGDSGAAEGGSNSQAC